MPLTEAQLERYSRNIKLKEFGVAGQEKLLSSRLLVIGAGGLGSPVILYLAAAGIGVLGIVDGDLVDASNLQRQILHTMSDIGRPKAASAKEKVNQLNPDVKVIAYPEKVTPESIERIIHDFDFILDCTDNLTAKLLINDACVLHGKPFSHGGVLGMSGRIMTYTPGHACMRCTFDIPQAAAAPTARELGILGAAAGTLGAMQAGEAIKYLTGCGKIMTDTLLHVDLTDCTFKKIPVKRDNKCPVCGKHPTIVNL
jgi:molybdopterin/thiamine biosynthesis adenylyltransferase